VIITASNGYTTRVSPGTGRIKDESTGVERKTQWHGDALVTEITGVASGTIIETYSVDAQHRLHVVIAWPPNRRAQVPKQHPSHDVCTASADERTDCCQRGSHRPDGEAAGVHHGARAVKQMLPRGTQQ
jgi:hypothetical protein